jgi:AcrR family transcriptional regulator
VKLLDPVIFKVRKESILSKARHLFATKGYAETTVDDVARDCGMQKASLYHYFSSKQELLQELVDLGCSRWSARNEHYAAGKDLRETLILIAKSFLQDMGEPAHQEFFKLIYFESHKNPSILKAFKESPANHREGLFAVFEKHLKDVLPRQSIAMYMMQFMGALIHYATISRLRGENLCPERFDDDLYIEQLVQRFASVPGNPTSPLERH